jgi:hypothetical protein
MYMDLRKNIVSTVYNSWYSTGFAWEQYNAETGAGQRTQGFTGWTALVANILAMPEFGDAVVVPKPEIQSHPKPSNFDMGNIFFFFLVFVVLALVSWAALAIKACYMREFGRPGYTGIVRVERPNPYFYLRLNHIRMFMPPGF